MRSFPVLSLITASIMTFSFGAAAVAAEDTAKAPGKAEVSLTADTVAAVNGVMITADVLDKVMQQAPQGTAGTDDPQMRRQVLEKLIEVEVIAQEAEKQGLDKDPDFVLSMDMLRKQQLYVGLIRKNVLEGVKVSPEDVKAYYEANKAQYISGEEVQASHILVDAEEDAKAIKARLDKGEDFAAVAKEESKCPSAQRGGDLGSFGKGRMVPEFEKAAFGLKVGEVSDPVKTQFGWHIIKVFGNKESKPRELDEVKDEIQQKLLQERQKKAYDELLEGLRAKADVKVNEGLFAKPEAKPEAGTPAETEAEPKEEPEEKHEEEKK